MAFKGEILTMKLRVMGFLVEYGINSLNISALFLVAIIMFFPYIIGPVIALIFIFF